MMRRSSQCFRCWGPWFVAAFLHGRLPWPLEGAGTGSTSREHNSGSTSRTRSSRELYHSHLSMMCSLCGVTAQGAGSCHAWQQTADGKRGVVTAWDLGACMCTRWDYGVLTPGCAWSKGQQRSGGLMDMTSPLCSYFPFVSVPTFPCPSLSRI